MTITQGATQTVKRQKDEIILVDEVKIHCGHVAKGLAEMLKVWSERRRSRRTGEEASIYPPSASGPGRCQWQEHLHEGIEGTFTSKGATPLNWLAGAMRSQAFRKAGLYDGNSHNIR